MDQTLFDTGTVIGVSPADLSTICWESQPTQRCTISVSDMKNRNPIEN